MRLSREQWQQASNMLRELFDHGTQAQKVKYASMYFDVQSAISAVAMLEEPGILFRLPTKRTRSVKPAVENDVTDAVGTPSAQPDETTHVLLPGTLSALAEQPKDSAAQESAQQQQHGKGRRK